MRPLVAFTGQGVARADGFNLTRRLKALAEVDAVASTVPWKDRQNLDEILAAAGARGPETLDAIVRAARAICLKERRSTQRKVTHRGLFETLAETAQSRLVVHLTANVDGLTSTFAARDFGATWPPYAAAASIAEIENAIDAVLRHGRGLVHLPVHGESALIERAGADGGALRTYYGDPAALGESGAWSPTLSSGLGSGAGRLAETLAIAGLGTQLLRALLLDEPVEIGASPIAPLGHADLIAIGYGAGSRPRRSEYPFERTITDVVERGAPRASQRFVALLYDAPDVHASARWYADHGFAVASYGDGELLVRLRESLLQARPAARSEPPSGERAAAPAVRGPAEPAPARSAR